MSISGISGNFSAPQFTAIANPKQTAGAGGISSAASGTPGGQDPAQALGTFVQDLMSALKAQGASSPAGADASATSGVTAPAGGHHHHHHGGGMAKMESSLQSLIQQVSASSSSDGTAKAGATSPAGNLQQDYQNLVTSFGGSANTASLGSFLQSLSQNIQSAGGTGGLISTKA
jgi:hypothetical protein